MRFSVSGYDYERKYAFVMPFHTALQPDSPSGLIASIPFVSMITAIVLPMGAGPASERYTAQVAARIPQDISRRNAVHARHEE